MAYSYTALKDFAHCPRKYHRVRITKTHKVETTEATEYGSAVHKALENYARDQTPLPYSLQQYQPYADALDVARATYTLIPEQTIGLTHDGQAVFGTDRADMWWARDIKIAGICDLLLLSCDRTTGKIADYKTGGDKYPDIEQLDLMAFLAMRAYPTLETLEAKLLYVKTGTCFPPAPKVYRREDLPEIDARFSAKIAEVETRKDALISDVTALGEQAKAAGLAAPAMADLYPLYDKHFPDNGGNPLCGWCPVTDCVFHQEFLSVRLRKERKS
mgnify:FL=1